MNNTNANLWEVSVLLAQQLPSPLGRTRVRLGSADGWEEGEEECCWEWILSKATLPSCTRDWGHHLLPSKHSQVGVGLAWPWHSLERLGSCLQPWEMLWMGNFTVAPGLLFIQACWN